MPRADWRRACRPRLPGGGRSLRSTAGSGAPCSGKPITAQASAAPVQRNENTMPKYSCKEAPTGHGGRTAAAGLAGDDRRQDQRHAHEPLTTDLARETPAREQHRPTAMPSGRLASIATVATRRLSRTRGPLCRAMTAVPLMQIVHVIRSHQLAIRDAGRLNPSGALATRGRAP